MIGTRLGDAMKDWIFNEDYLRKLTEGDPEVESHFVSHFSGLLRVKLRIKLRSVQTIEDIRQETFLRVFLTLRKKDGIQSPEKLGAFVNAVCNNVMMESFRASIRYRQMPQDVPEIIDQSADPSQNLVTEERRKLVEALLEELSAKDREILRRFFLEEQGKEAIARTMGVSPEYLRVLVHRAKTRFRSAFENLKPSGLPQ